METVHIQGRDLKMPLEEEQVPAFLMVCANEAVIVDLTALRFAPSWL